MTEHVFATTAYEVKRFKRLVGIPHFGWSCASTPSLYIVVCLFSVYSLPFTVHARILVHASMQHSILSCSHFSTCEHAAFMLNWFVFEHSLVLEVRCGTMAKHMNKCSRCKFLRYCSAECQRKDWKAHKRQCDATLWPRERRHGSSHFFGMVNGYDYDRWFFTLFEGHWTIRVPAALRF